MVNSGFWYFFSICHKSLYLALGLKRWFSWIYHFRMTVIFSQNFEHIFCLLALKKAFVGLTAWHFFVGFILVLCQPVRSLLLVLHSIPNYSLFIQLRTLGFLNCGLVYFLLWFWKILSYYFSEYCLSLFYKLLDPIRYKSDLSTLPHAFFILSPFFFSSVTLYCILSNFFRLIF